jgi:hypothetical protein
MELAMLRFIKKLALVPALLFIVTACDQAGAGSPMSPKAPNNLLGLGGTAPGYTLVRDPLLPVILGIPQALTTGTLIGFGGGQVTLLGHVLTVPTGAVSQPTLFTLTVLPTGYVEVNLLGTLSTLLGVLDVGSKGFLKPIPVSLTYERATNVSDPSKLKVLRIQSLLGYGTYQVMPSTVDSTTKKVTAQLDHFSRYTLAYPE